MEKETKIKSMLGLARRSGQMESGVRPVEHGLKHGRLQVVLIATDASDATKRKIEYSVRDSGVAFFSFLTKDLLGQVTGQSDKAVIGIRNGAIAEVVISLLK